MRTWASHPRSHSAVHMDLETLIDNLYKALQAVSSCPRGCKCCSSHEAAVRAVLAEYLKAWQARQVVRRETVD